MHMHFLNLLIVYFTLFITALFVGIVGNTIGIGGGILLVPFFIFYMHLSPLESSGLSLFTIMLSAMGGSYIFYKDKTIDLNLYLMILLPALFGIIIGSVLSRYILTDQFKWVLSFIIIGIGIFSLIATKKQAAYKNNYSDKYAAPLKNRHRRFLRGHIRKTLKESNGTTYDYEIKSPLSINIFSLIAGFVSGFIGIGIGGITGTFLTAVEQIPPRIAFSTIISIMAIISLIGGLIHFYYIKNPLHMAIYIIPLGAGALTGSKIGAFISKNSKAKILRIYQGTFIILLGVLMLALSAL
ncbi:MAG: sulfite exporter TauE/SafE family protein [Candidatus Acidulodesulfobacterium ferriphilum]|uniref:Probable membrane transporter protein n=1 Tax=Candidatus Acidulodesulfobacterium ferriphilum TaxID=2597223 RepID=A0A519BBL0_9DELT|nr:MAG: sulfite exporter TauE/SafE family protein [Candidatus Acidulodesulfobacterium ferriphilum]